MRWFPDRREFDIIERQRLQVAKIGRLRQAQPEPSVTVWEALLVIAVILLIVVVLPFCAQWLSEVVN